MKVNFFSQEKVGDWRFREYQKIQFSSNTLQQKIYWIGVIKFSDITEEKVNIPIYYCNHNGKLVKDFSQKRREDGADLGSVTPTLYKIGEIHKHLLGLKKRFKKMNYVNICLLECVHKDGFHSVAILTDKDGILLIFPTKKPWTQEPVFHWIPFHSYEVSELVSFYLLNEKSYHWMK